MIPRNVGALLVAMLTACGGPSPEVRREGQLEGRVQVSPSTRGDGWVFLYPPGAGYPLTQAFPERVTAVPDLRLSSGDARYLFAEVEPNPYRLWAFVDTNRDFSADIDVLGGPGAGDRVASGVELNLQPGEDASVDLPVNEHVLHEPPAFVINRVEPGSMLELPDQPNGVIALDLVSHDLGVLRPDRTVFVVGLGDADGDGVADDSNADGVPDLFPQIYLRFLRRPGQVVPLDPKGTPAEVIVPLAFNPGPFLAALAGDPSKDVVVDSLQAAVIPQAQAITHEPGRGRVVTAMDAIPVGEYELWVVNESGQFWRLPNDLRGEAAAGLGGPFPTQGVQFRFVHGTVVPATGPPAPSP